jgi:hypothetical protein
MCVNSGRECRGIIFHKATGQMLARRLHKFFNINEMEETAPERLDMSRPHVLLEKADGYVDGEYESCALELNECCVCFLPPYVFLFHPVGVSFHHSCAKENCGLARNWELRK